MAATSGTITIGRECAVGKRSDLLCEDVEIRIGDYVRIAAEVFISTGNHVFDRDDIPIYKQGLRQESVVIGDDVWIGRRAIILPGVTIGRGAVVGAGAVVTRSVGAGLVVGGVPARPIRARMTENANAVVQVGT